MMQSLLPTLVEWMGVIAVTLLLSLSPAFQRRRPVQFVYPRREGIIAISLAVLSALLAAVLFSSFFSGAALPSDPLTSPTAPPANQPFTYSLAQLVQQAELALVAAAPFLLALAIRRQPLLSAGLSRASLRPGLQLGAALALITIFLTNKIYAIINGLTQAELLYLVAMLIVGLAEEFIFRGYIQLRLMGWLGEIQGWLLAAAIYALWHLPQKLILEGAALPQLGLSLAYLFVFGLLLGWIMRKSGSVLATGIYHAVHNWIQIL